MKAKERLEKWLAPSLRGVALVFGLFSLVMTVLLIATAVRLQNTDPLNSQALTVLRQRLASEPSDESLAEEIRGLDLLARGAYFTARDQIDTGAVLLAVAFGIVVAALRLAAYLGKRIADPSETARVPLGRSFAAARRAVLIGGSVLIAGTCVAAFLSTRDLASDFRGVVKALGLGDYPSRGEFLSNWPGFRGPLAGVAPGKPAAAAGAGPSAGAGSGTDAGAATTAARPEVLWATTLALEGRSSPAVWADRIYLTGASARAQEIYCLNTEKGSLLWTRSVKDLIGRSPAVPDVSADTGWAAPSPATDGRRVFVMFAGGQLLCLDGNGALKWYKDFGIPENAYGIASSPVIWEDEVIVQWDQANASLVMAFQSSSGRLLWRHERELLSSWATPIVVEDGRFLALLVVGNPAVEALDLRTGETLWESDIVAGDAAPSPAYGSGMAFIASNLTPVTALPAAASNGNMAVEPAWIHEEDLPDTPSLLAAAQRLYVVSGTGTVSCLDEKTGRLLWKQRLETGVSSSPILVGGTVFLGDKSGILHRFADSAMYSPREDISLAGPIWATPAYRDGRLYVRAGRALICLGGAQ